MSEDLLQTIDEWGPEKVLCVSDRRTGMRGVLVIDNTARGMGKGGTRMSPTLTVGEVARLARTMTWKWAAVDLFFGGAKAGILGDPTSPGREPVLRAFARRLSSEVPREYVLGLDMGLTERDAAIFLDELGVRSASVGLPHELGGLPYDQLGVTGHGVAEVIASAAEVTGLRLGDSSVVIQGFGAVGAATARRLAQLGAVVVAVSTSRGAVHDVNGLDVEELLTLRAEFGDACVEHLGRPVLECGAELRLPADVLVPAAMQDVVTGDVARQTTARLVVEAANMPTTPEAKRVLHQRGITVVPDFIANAGGAVAAAFSMDARQSPFRADKDAVFATVSERLASNTAHVLEHAGSHGMTTHDAALDLARHRVRAAMQLRGQARASGGTPQ